MTGLAATAALVSVASFAAPAQADELVGLTLVTPQDSTESDPIDTGWLWDRSTSNMADVRSAIGADALVQRGFDGSGIGVALVDTGVVPVSGLTRGNVVDGPDVSFESQAEDLRHFDTFGHGTHMAGIIAGDAAGAAGIDPDFRGIAPGVKLTSIKVGANDGAVDVSQVIAAVDWVVAHRRDDPKNPIRVLNLSYGTDGTQSYRSDPLTHAVENAWRAGIVVVVAAGNDGADAASLSNPAYDPKIIAVGASDTHGTAATDDDTVADFSNRGNASRRVDIVAPGRSIASLRDPGSFLDSEHPEARTDNGLFKGSGTSQAAAVVTGAVALLLDAKPCLDPNQVKSLLRRSASPLPLADTAGQGMGALDIRAASLLPVWKGAQRVAPSTGLGSLEAARGTQHVADAGVELTGEQDILGPWDASAWAAASSAGSSWSLGSWNSREWTGDCRCSTTWSGSTWSSVSWTGRSWAGRSWAGRSWAGRSWAGRSWAGESWAGRSWAGRSWAGGIWS